jgi:hypothetical protein
MEMPNLPTDNLYKFQALAGLASMLFFIWFFAEQLDRASLEFIKFGNYAASLHIEINNLETDLGRFEKHLKVIEPGQLRQSDIDEVNQLQTRIHEIELKQQESENNMMLLHYTKLKLLLLLAAAPMLFFYSMIYTRRGFRNWHRKVQVYQDRILKIEAEKYLFKK